mgnify:FL=1
MPMNAIQFQPGMSLAQFQQRYGSEQQCESALIAARWPQGFVCAHCGCKRYFPTRNGQGRQLWECFLCGYQSSSIAGTVMEHTRLPLRLWFLAMYLLTQHKTGISALALKRYLGVSYKSAWLLKHKLMQAMAQHDGAYRLQGRVEIDDAYLGGERAGSINGGRKAANKSAFVAAVQTTEQGYPQYVHLTPVADFTNQEMLRWAQQHLAPGCHVVSDGTMAFARVCQAQATHERYVTGGGRQGAQTPQLHWVNTVLGNLKTSLVGTYNAFKHAKYGARYLAEFAYRFNRRFDLPGMLPKLLKVAVTTAALPLKAIRSSGVSDVCS